MANYLYNGVELPDINEVWTDKEAYPYAYIASRSIRCLVIGKSVNHYKAGYVWAMSLSNYCYYELNDTCDEWSLVEKSNTGAYGANIGSIIWSNTDVLHEDGSVYLKASDPVPVGLKPTTIVYMDIGGVRKKVTAYKDIGGVRILISKA